ncbi:MAG TPA: 30S ribosomal protein S6 [Candidatus Paceibacterota bacterium]|nr:30S ribosomal protein S6 [Candidatus Paceibacterota bacterium]HMO82789.1 30S ribosomal protein S6 [Candidatus Paceibacterota bacterium]
MSETNMPAAEATVTNDKDVMSYEFAFHILPTVAEGEVKEVVEKIKAQITKAGGEIFDQEEAKRFDLAYDIEKYLEGRNRKFSSAYFGWIRFHLYGANLEGLTEEIDGNKELLRYLLVKLTKVEEANPFRFHDSIADRKVRTIDTEEVVDEVVEAETDGVVSEEVTAEVADETSAPVEETV